MFNIPTFPFALTLVIDQRTASDIILSATADQEWRELYWFTPFKPHVIKAYECIGSIFFSSMSERMHQIKAFVLVNNVILIAKPSTRCLISFRPRHITSNISKQVRCYTIQNGIDSSKLEECCLSYTCLDLLEFLITFFWVCFSFYLANIFPSLPSRKTPKA